ncbi:hypothetical protein GCM10009721_08650 [Terrabacter tumescens]|uniref:HTH luxR-type domain-containing protein n=1 Tax=Terrabacter tumescens TaxID=60443 RepID=A0ABQ2HP81_9MICO|nr:LuxR C-terminal-related transcriptional regulator [Terrabacter tumescens]GGM86153.1 hypothetical protein GCM10009721_08650 [Terrabacter tumescens]
MDDRVWGIDATGETGLAPTSLVSPLELAAYEHLAFTPDWTPETLAGALGDCAVDEVPPLLERLRAHGLVRPSQQDADRIVAVSPVVGLGRLAGDAEQGLLEQSQYVQRLRLLTNSLSERYAQLRADRAQDSESEVVSGRDAAVVRVGELLRDCTESVDSVVAAAPTPQALEQARVGDAGLLARGVRVRAIYQEGHPRQSRALQEHLRWLSEHGAHVRLAGITPVRLMVFDGTVAAVALDPGQPGSGALVLRSPGAVHAMTALFDLLWDSARPAGTAPTAGAQEQPLTELETAVVRLLARGNKDEAISRRTGVSVRSVRRIIAGLMDTMNAASRFELGLRCRDRGLV